MQIFAKIVAHSTHHKTVHASAEARERKSIVNPKINGEWQNKQPAPKHHQQGAVKR